MLIEEIVLELTTTVLTVRYNRDSGIIVAYYRDSIVEWRLPKRRSLKP